MRLAALGTLMLVVTSCSFRELGYLSQQPDASKPKDAAVGDAPVSPSDTTAGDECPALPGPKMIRIDSFCIDSTEVTERHYREFLEDPKTTTAGQIAVCAWNTSFAPDPDFFPKSPNLPIRTIDWCDAYAYCQWAGKRLCGKIGGGPASALSADDPEADQWYRACSKAGALEYPYGNAYDGAKCQTKASGAVDVGSKKSCEGGYAGLLDMSGNVWEWEDACDDKGHCPLRGGSWGHDGVAVSCHWIGGAHFGDDRKASGADYGFRCCSK